jgi:hypothetical protein
MRTLIIGSVLALAFVGVGRGQPQQAGREAVVIAPNIPRTLSISRDGVTLTTLTIPQGTVISVIFDTPGPVLPPPDGRFVFHGNIEIRAMAVGQKPSHLPLWEAMKEAPLQLAATGMDVVIAPQ